MSELRKEIQRMPQQIMENNMALLKEEHSACYKNNSTNNLRDQAVKLEQP